MKLNLVKNLKKYTKIILLILIILLIIYFIRRNYYENYTSKIADVKNKNVPFQFKVLKPTNDYTITVFKVNGIGANNKNTIIADNNPRVTLTKNVDYTYQGTSGTYGWVLCIEKPSSVKNFNLDLDFFKNVSMGDADIENSQLTLNTSNNMYTQMINYRMTFYYYVTIAQKKAGNKVLNGNLVYIDYPDFNTTITTIPDKIYVSFKFY